VEVTFEVGEQLEGPVDLQVEGDDFLEGILGGGVDEVGGDAVEKCIVGAQICADVGEGGSFELPV